ncbi:hypothetical protein AALB39_12125 [Lachnospiraceae bacterium 54-53]
MNTMIVLINTILIIIEYTVLDFLLSGRRNFIKNVTFGISYFFFMFLIVSEFLFAINYYSLLKTYLICGGIALIIILLLFILKYKCNIFYLIKQEQRQPIPVDLLVLLVMGFIITANRFELFGMGQDQGVYQIKAILMTEGDNSNYFTIKENEIVSNESDKNKLYDFIESQKAGMGFYSLKTNSNRGTITISENDLYTGVFHGLPNFPALLSITGKIFGLQGIMYILQIFYLLSIIVVYLICFVNLQLKRTTCSIITLLFMLSPIIVWVSKSALTEIVLTLIILVFIFLLTSKERSDKMLLWFPVTVFSFTHVSIYTIIPMFIIVFVILLFQEGEKGYFITGIISIISYFLGLVVMGHTSPRYTFDNYMPLLSLIKASPDANHVFIIALIGVMVALIFLTCSYIVSQKGNNTCTLLFCLLNIIKLLIFLCILIISVKWFRISYNADYDDQWNYYKNNGLFGSIQNITFFTYLIWSGVIIIPVTLYSIIKLKIKNSTEKCIVPIIFMFTYCILFYSTFLRYEIQYYYYYSRYIAPFLSLAFILGAYFIDKNLKLKIITGVISSLIFLPFSFYMMLFDDISKIDFYSFIKTKELVSDLEEKSTLVIEDSLLPIFFYPLDSNPDLYVFSESLFNEVKDTSFLDEHKLFYLSTRELSFYLKGSSSMKSSFLGISPRTKVTDLFKYTVEQEKVNLYELNSEQLKELPIKITKFGSQNGILTEGALISNGLPGFVLYGNYEDLNSGDYKYTYEIRLIENKSGNNEVGYLDVMSDKGKNEHEKVILTLDNLKKQNGIIELPFRLTEKEQFVEGRVFVNEGVKLEVSNVKLKEISEIN